MKHVLEIEIPKSIEGVTLGQYQQYVQLLGGSKDSLDTASTTEFFRLKLVSIFTGVKVETIRNTLTIKQVDRIANKLHRVLQNLNAYEPKQLTTTFKHRGIEFGIEPDFENMSAGAFADLSSYYGKWEDAHRVLAVLYRPIVKTYNNKLLGITQHEIAPYNGTKEYAELMKQLPAVYAVEVNFRMLHLFTVLRRSFLEYFQTQMKLPSEIERQLTLLRFYSPKSGVGTSGLSP